MHVLAMLIFLCGPHNVKADLDLCAFCETQQAGGVLLDEQWLVGRGRLSRLLPPDEELLRFFSEPCLFERAAGSLFEYQCDDLSDFDDSTVAITHPGELYFTPTRVLVERSLFEGSGVV